MKYWLWSFLCLRALVSINAENSSQFVIDYNAWWGPTDQDNPYDTSIEKYEIAFDDEMITDLRERLSKYRPSAPTLEGTKSEYGFNIGCLDEYIKYWAEEYDFSGRAVYLNQYQHYRTKIEGILIHFIWVKQNVTNKKVVPLLLIHGWPGSIREFYDMIPLLTADCDDKDYVIELVIVSIPGFAYSDVLCKMFAYLGHIDYTKRLAQDMSFLHNTSWPRLASSILVFDTNAISRTPGLPSILEGHTFESEYKAAVRPGLGGNEIAVTFNKLMIRLGYDTYIVHGGDWGAFIGSSMATLFPENVIGYHTNMPIPFTWKTIMMMVIGQFLPDLVVDKSLASRLYPLPDALSWSMLVTGYMHYQATKPDTLGIGLSDSPVGFMSHVFSMMSSVTRKSNGNITDCEVLENYYTREQLFDNLMLYWAPNKITTASRMYAESFNKKTFTAMILEEPTAVPTWVIQAPDEMVYFSPVMMKTKWTKLVGVTVLKEGGHFLALENPKVLAEDLLKAVQEFIWIHEENSWY